MQIIKGSTDVTVYFHLRSTSDGTSKTGLTYNSPGAIASYMRSRGVRTAISLVTLGGPDSAHSDGGFIEVDGTNAKGLYRLDIPDAAVASGVDEVIIHIGFTGVFEESLSLELVEEPASGAGALSCTWTQKDTDENPIDNVQVWLSTDAGGSNVIAGTLLTNAQGQVTFMLDASTYYVWREKAGYNFTNPQTWTVS